MLEQTRDTFYSAHDLGLDPSDPLQVLHLADPGLADTVTAILAQKTMAIPAESLGLLVEETLWAVSLEMSFGFAVARGFAELVGDVEPERIEIYRQTIRNAGENGPALGRLMADYLAPVVKCGNGYVDRFLNAVSIMRQKGTYTLKKPLESLSNLIQSGDLDSVPAYLGLLCDAFSQNLSYNQSLHLTQLLPKAVLAFPDSRRSWQISRFRRVIREDFRLAAPFLDGMEKGLDLLSDKNLDRFISLGLDKFREHADLGKKFLSLESHMGRETCSRMQVTVPLVRVKDALNRYLRARIGKPITVRSLGDVSSSALNTDLYGPVNDIHARPMVCSDGKAIYIPDEIGVFAGKTENRNLYKYLAGLESAYYEFGTFDFDLEKAMAVCGMPQVPDKAGTRPASDLERFFNRFPNIPLAAGLFTIFEHARLHLLLKAHYPGMIRHALPLLRNELKRMYPRDLPVPVLLYARIALDLLPEPRNRTAPPVRHMVDTIKDMVIKSMHTESSVHESAKLVYQTYEIVNNALGDASHCDARWFSPPFYRFPRPDLVYSANMPVERMAGRIKATLEAHGIRVYKADVRKRLNETGGTISPADIEQIILTPDIKITTEEQSGEIAVKLSETDLSAIFASLDVVMPDLVSDDTGGEVFWYKEWDREVQDYLPSHARVAERQVTGRTGGFYSKTLLQHQGLVRRIRRAFELLRPEALTILRQWVEGDEFDYRALLDYAMDRRAGITPSDRLYIKRIKQQRDVAVLLLVDLSRSTANTVTGRSEVTVLDVEKEAIVLFCEALEVVGDRFAIAGFSGTGRLGVDYFKIKDFDDQMDDEIQNRISAMAPQRGTRMGAAIRHATSRIGEVDAKVRVLILLGDGFPNDTGYKRDYAIEDTRRAVLEARATDIHVKAITVNIPGDPKLDDLYGPAHHNVISDVKELPDRLLRIYGEMTR